MVKVLFSQRLRELREQAGLTQEALARESGVPLGSLRNYEQAHREPYWDVIFRLAKAMSVGCEAFADCVTSQVGKSAKPKKDTKKRKGT